MRYIAWAGYDLTECSTDDSTTVSGGCTLVIWNGTGAQDSGGDWSHLGHGTESAEARYSGSNGLDATSFTSSKKIYFQDINDNNVDDYNTLRMYINLREWPENANALVYFEEGNSVNLSEYLKTYNLDRWQEVVIALDDFGLTAPINLNKLTIESRSSIGLYLDDVEFVVGVQITTHIPIDAPSMSAENYVPVLRAFGPPSDI